LASIDRTAYRFSTPAPQPSEQPENPVDATTEVLGQKLGRPTVMNPDKIRMASELVGKESVAAIARLLGVNRATIYAHVPELQNRHRTALPRARAHRGVVKVAVIKRRSGAFPQVRSL
jgi:hypothetical protein